MYYYIYYIIYSVFSLHALGNLGITSRVKKKLEFTKKDYWRVEC